jgi:hypothetical protein
MKMGKIFISKGERIQFATFVEILNETPETITYQMLNSSEPRTTDVRSFYKWHGDISINTEKLLHRVNMERAKLQNELDNLDFVEKILMGQKI